MGEFSGRRNRESPARRVAARGFCTYALQAADAAGPGLLQVTRQVLVHLEHADLVLAAEDRLQLGVGQDLPLVGGVLQVVLLDVVPDLRDHLAPGQLAGADDGGKLRRGRQGLLQCVVLLVGHEAPPARYSAAAATACTAGTESLPGILGAIAPSATGTSIRRRKNAGFAGSSSCKRLGRTRLAPPRRRS